jgi:hypothetical protein
MQKGKNKGDRMRIQGKVKILFEKGGGAELYDQYIDQSRNEWTKTEPGHWVGGGVALCFIVPEV